MHFSVAGKQYAYNKIIEVFTVDMIMLECFLSS